jgi:hypothetical protein
MTPNPAVEREPKSCAFWFPPRFALRLSLETSGADHGFLQWRSSKEHRRNRGLSPFPVEICPPIPSKGTAHKLRLWVPFAASPSRWPDRCYSIRFAARSRYEQTFSTASLGLKS